MITSSVVRGTMVRGSPTVSEDEVRGSSVRGSAPVSEDEVRGTAGGADAVDVAGSEKPRKSSDRAIIVDA